MPCPHRRSAADEDHGIDRREFMKAAVAIGGASALATARARAHGEGGADGDGHVGQPPTGIHPDPLPTRQYAWNGHCPTNETTLQAKTPEHHLQFMLDYADDGTPTDDEREQVEAALHTLERAYEWSNKGLLFTVGYSNAYFDRFDADLPDDIGLRPPEEVIEESDIDRSGKIEADDYDAHMHLASDNGLVLLEAEQALFGNERKINGVEVEATFEGVFEKKDRRTGFINNPHEEWEEEIGGENPVGEDAPVWFGFKSLFKDSQPSEERVAITDSDTPFDGGTTEQVSLLRDEGIKAWYNRNSHEERAARMYSPHHTSEDTGPHGRELGETSGTDELSMSDPRNDDDIARRTREDAEEKGVVGHAQKLARARDEDGRPRILRRDFPSTDGNRAHTQFISNQRTIDDFIEVRKAMAFVDQEEGHAESEVPIKDHGIQGYFRVQSRGTFLVPPRSLRALPPADPPANS